MPVYIYKHPKKEEYIEVIQSMNEDHVYFDEDGLEWNREFTNPQLNCESNIDPFDNNAFIEKTGKMKGTYGDMIDLSSEMSEKRKSVPTQSFIDIHVYGIPTLIKNKEQIHKILDIQVNSRESRQKDPWSSDELPNNSYNKLLEKIYGIEISIDRLRVNYRLLQNKPTKDIKSILDNDEIPDNLKTRIKSINKL